MQSQSEIEIAPIQTEITRAITETNTELETETENEWKREILKRHKELRN